VPTNADFFFWLLLAQIAFHKARASREGCGGTYLHAGWASSLDTAQIWTIWRTSDGYEVEDKLPVDKGAMLMAAMGAALDTKMSPNSGRHEKRHHDDGH